MPATREHSYTRLTDGDTRPVLLLDVDGVINDLEALHYAARLPYEEKTVWARENEYRVFEADAGGGIYTIWMPTYMPALIQHLDQTCEIVWCTTWTYQANYDIAEQLGVGPYPVLTPGRLSEFDWKPDAAAEVAGHAHRAGRDVYWIEDFCGRLPRMMADITYIDTAPEMVLGIHHLPDELKPETA